MLEEDSRHALFRILDTKEVSPAREPGSAIIESSSNVARDEADILSVKKPVFGEYFNI